MTEGPGVVACGCNNQPTLGTIRKSAKYKKTDSEDVKDGKEIEQQVEITAKSEKENKHETSRTGKIIVWEIRNVYYWRIRSPEDFEETVGRVVSRIFDISEDRQNFVIQEQELQGFRIYLNKFDAYEPYYLCIWYW